MFPFIAFGFLVCLLCWQNSGCLLKFYVGLGVLASEPSVLLWRSSLMQQISSRCTIFRGWCNGRRWSLLGPARSELPSILATLLIASTVVGGSCFVISSAIFTLETQKSWWRIEPLKLGWHVGLWNLIGGLGFTLWALFAFNLFLMPILLTQQRCGGLGLNSSSGAQYQSACSTFWYVIFILEW